MSTPMADLFSQPGTWVQGAVAVNEAGQEVDEYSRSAVGWCLVGAMCKFHPDKDVGRMIRNYLDIYSIVEWNNKPGRTQEEVYRLCKELQI